MPGLGAGILDEATTTQEWFRSRAQLDLWGPGQTSLHIVDVPSFAANAAAGMIDGRATTFQGPTSRALREALRDESATVSHGGAPSEIELTARHLHRHRTAVMTHEGGHIATARAWGPAVVRYTGLTTVQGMIEEAVVDAL